MLAVHGGTHYQIEALEGRYARWFAATARPEALPDLHAFDAVLVTCRTPGFRITAAAPALRRFLDRGGCVVAMGETRPDLWLPGARFTPEPTDWWWWLTPGAALGVRIAAPGHPLLGGLADRDLTWHLHGWFDPPPGATVLATDGQGRAIFYADRASTGGLIVATTLDPFYHHGSHFMPATTRFLDGFLPALAGHLAETVR
jgi:hypothetical protein